MMQETGRACAIAFFLAGGHAGAAQEGTVEVSCHTEAAAPAVPGRPLATGLQGYDVIRVAGEEEMDLVQVRIAIEGLGVKVIDTRVDGKVLWLRLPAGTCEGLE